MTRNGFALAFAGVAGISIAIASPEGFKLVSEALSGYEEVPAVSTGASGEPKARISNDESEIDWELTYSDLDGAVQQAHSVN